VSPARTEEIIVKALQGVSPLILLVIAATLEVSDGPNAIHRLLTTAFGDQGLRFWKTLAVASQNGIVQFFEC
jgi:hypothetical protein